MGGNPTLNEPGERDLRPAAPLSPVPAPEDDVTLSELIEIAKRLPYEDRLELLRYARFRKQSAGQSEKETD